ncbi:MAG: LPS export ABC transporter periplasmic protein LptC [Methylocella sp.]
MTEVSGNADWSAGTPIGGAGPDATPEGSGGALDDLLGAGRSPWRGAFKAAGRHSARVRFLRRAIVIGCVIAVAVVGIVAAFDPFRRLPRNISIGEVHVDGTRIMVDSPNIVGFQNNGRPYEVKARSGIQDTTTPDIVELLDIDAKIGMADASTLQLTSTHGVYDSLHDKLALDGAARIKNEVGYDIFMKTARLNFKTGDLVTEDPVNVILKNGTVAANQMNISDNGDKISFEGAVKSIIETAESEKETSSAPVIAE